MGVYVLSLLEILSSGHSGDTRFLPDNGCIL